jgi:hypothetical protein
VIGFGAASLADGDEAERGIALLLEHCGFGGMDYDRSPLAVTAVYKIELESFTGKRLFLKG